MLGDDLLYVMMVNEFDRPCLMFILICRVDLLHLMIKLSANVHLDTANGISCGVRSCCL